jgi:hypothetical protein
MADAAALGVIHGNTITLDAPVPPLEGRRVRVTIEPVDDDTVQLSHDEQRHAWDDWIRRGPSGPLEDDDDPEFP